MELVSCVFLFVFSNPSYLLIFRVVRRTSKELGMDPGLSGLMAISGPLKTKKKKEFLLYRNFVLVDYNDFVSIVPRLK